MNNLKQIGLGCLMYANDYNECLPGYEYLGLGAGGGGDYDAGYVEWWIDIAPYVFNISGGQDRTTLAASWSVTMPYYCPSQNPHSWGTGTWSDYGFNIGCHNNQAAYNAFGAAGMKLSRLTSPSVTFILADTGDPAV